MEPSFQCVLECEHPYFTEGSLCVSDKTVAFCTPLISILSEISE